VAIAGALGGYIHLSTSFVDYIGNRRFYASWKWWYGLRPFIGSSLAIIVYFAARGGLVAGTNGASTLSPYGIAAMAGLAGLFSKQATDKLREVFDTLFKPTAPTKRAEPLDGVNHS
jgi:ABC-type transporter Mla maintaining outer membrane lipid asymmetry permease subunit MlaE